MKQLVQQLQEWHITDEHKKITEAIEALPEQDKDYTIQCLYARALNNLNQEKAALNILLPLKNQGQNDPLWHFRVGYAYFYLDEEEEAIPYLEKAIQLGDDSSSAQWLLNEARFAAEKKKAVQQHYQAHWKNRTPPPEGAPVFENFNLENFWETSEYSEKNYQSLPPSDELIAQIEQDLGYKLPQSYIWLMKQQNGGIPINKTFPTEIPTSWADDHIAIEGIFGIGYEKPNSLGGSLGSRFMIEEWGYPPIGIAICDCPSAGHDMVFLDYSHCGPKGEPAVVHVDQERYYAITYLADTFEAFINGLIPEGFYQEEDTLQNSGVFNPEQLADAAQAAHFSDIQLLADMRSDAYYPPFLVNEIAALLQNFMLYLQSGPHTYGEIQEQLDLLVEQINNMQQAFYDNGSDIETIARESIADTIYNILQKAQIQIEIEQAIRMRDW